MKFTTMRLPLLSTYFVHVTSTYSPKQPFLEHPPSMRDSSKILRYVCWYVIRRNKMSPFSGSGSSRRFLLDCLTLKMEPHAPPKRRLYQSIRPNIPKNLNVYPQSTSFSECESPSFTPLDTLMRSTPNSWFTITYISSVIDICDTGGLHSVLIEDTSLLGCDVVSLLYSYPTFLTDVVFSSSGVEGSRKV